MATAIRQKPVKINDLPEADRKAARKVLKRKGLLKVGADGVEYFLNPVEVEIEDEAVEPADG